MKEKTQHMREREREREREMFWLQPAKIVFVFMAVERNNKFHERKPSHFVCVCCHLAHGFFSYNTSKDFKSFVGWGLVVLSLICNFMYSVKSFIRKRKKIASRYDL